MNQPTREAIYSWTVDYIRNNEQICIEDLGA